MMESALEVYAKEKNIAISSVLVLSIISVIITVILTRPVPYSWKNSNKIMPILFHCTAQSVAIITIQS